MNNLSEMERDALEHYYQQVNEALQAYEDGVSYNKRISESGCKDAPRRGALGC